MVYLTCSVVMKSGLKRGFRYFKVSPIKALRDVCHVHVDKVFAIILQLVPRLKNSVRNFGNLSFSMVKASKPPWPEVLCG